MTQNFIFLFSSNNLIKPYILYFFQMQHHPLWPRWISTSKSQDFLDSGNQVTTICRDDLLSGRSSERQYLLRLVAISRCIYYIWDSPGNIFERDLINMIAAGLLVINICTASSTYIPQFTINPFTACQHSFKNYFIARLLLEFFS